MGWAGVHGIDSVVHGAFSHMKDGLRSGYQESAGNVLDSSDDWLNRIELTVVGSDFENERSLEG